MLPSCLPDVLWPNRCSRRWQRLTSARFFLFCARSQCPLCGVITAPHAVLRMVNLLFNVNFNTFAAAVTVNVSWHCDVVESTHVAVRVKTANDSDHPQDDRDSRVWHNHVTCVPTKTALILARQNSPHSVSVLRETAPPLQEWRGWDSKNRALQSRIYFVHNMVCTILQTREEWKWDSTFLPCLQIE